MTSRNLERDPLATREPKIIWEKNGSVLWWGDCREVLPGLEKGVVLTDPPYGPETVANTRKQGDRSRLGPDASSVDDFEFQYTAISEEEIPSFAGPLVAACSRWLGLFSCVETSHVWRQSLRDAGLDYVRTCAWVKPGSAPQFTGDRPSQGWEPLTLMHPRGRKRWAGGGSAGVWVVPVPRGEEAGMIGGQKPLALMLELVSLFSEPGEAVIDPFAGSGSTLVAALRLGRRAVGCEIREDAAYAVAERLEAESQGLSLRDARAGQQPLFPSEASK